MVKLDRLMKMEIAIALTVESWTKPSVCIKIMFLQCKNVKSQVPPTNSTRFYPIALYDFSYFIIFQDGY